MTNPEMVVSTLRGDSPEMDTLIADFIARLPHFRAEIANDLEKRSWGALKDVVHKMKGLGGGYGYAELSTFARNVEVEIAQNNDMSISEATKQLITYIDQIIKSGL